MSVTFPEGLENMYGRIVKLICSRNRPEQQLAKWIIKWITFSQRQLTTHELQAWRNFNNGATDIECDDLPHFSKTIVMICSGLIEVGNIKQSAYVVGESCLQFIHLTAREYFSRFEVSDNDDTCENPPTGVGLEARSHLEIAQSCLKYLTYHMPAQRLSERLSLYSIPANLNKDFPLSNYAASCWIDHLHKGLAESERLYKTSSSIPMVDLDAMMTALFRFLSQDLVLVSWIETSYIFHKVPAFESEVEISVPNRDDSVVTVGKLPLFC